jgi:uncharacterized membrane protein HdeD (DUF308 family)
MTQPRANEAGLQTAGLEELRRSWGWYVALGIALVILGTIALGRTFLMTVASVLFFGWLLIIGGVMESVHAFWRKKWIGFVVDFLLGILYVVVGFMVVANPGASAVALTLLIAMVLIFRGIFRFVAALAVRPPSWGWSLLSGLVGVLLGILIWRQWPLSGLWVIGLFVGIEMIFSGWSLLMLGLAAKNLPGEVTAET